MLGVASAPADTHESGTACWLRGKNTPPNDAMDERAFDPGPGSTTLGAANEATPG
jgi:hypothetical protein